jgi:putative endonuclease
MYYVYLLRSQSNAKKTYVGMTDDVAARLQKHNAGGSPHTSKYRPWELIASVGVRTKDKAAELEKYFKTGSGHAFAHKHLW